VGRMRRQHADADMSLACRRWPARLISSRVTAPDTAAAGFR
jgi:hypothetical protein